MLLQQQIRLHPNFFFKSNKNISIQANSVPLKVDPIGKRGKCKNGSDDSIVVLKGQEG